VTDASALSSVHGLPVTREWLESERDFSLKTTAKFILVIEKEGIYTRLSEDRFFERVPCILVTGKGYPDLATRALVHTLYQQFALPVYGICDCNPHGLGVLQTYRRGNERLGVDGGDRYSVPIQWLGLKPSQVQLLQLPQPVYQTMTDYDLKKLESIMQDLYFDDEELGAMQTQGYKVELEALQWLGMNHLSDWLEDKSLGL
jgi:meiotic recombination protein SPO11